MSIWDDPELQAGGDFVKFEAVGDSIAGTITAIRRQRWEDGSVAPQILLTADDGTERTITAGQIRLKTKLAELRPEAGDHITITLTEVEKRSGGKTLKHFDVQVRPNGVKPAMATTPVAASPAPGVTPEMAAALAQLTPEQKAALNL
jgi:hypothetical protein